MTHKNKSIQPSIMVAAVIMILGTVLIIGIGFFLDYKERQKTDSTTAITVTESQPVTEATPVVSQALWETMEKLTDLEAKSNFVHYLISTKTKELKDENLKTEEKNLLQAVLDYRKEQQKILNERITLNYYFKDLTEEIQKLEDQIQKSKTVEEKYSLKETQSAKEKECLKIKETEKLIDEKEELNKVIADLKKQIDETKSSETDKKTKLNTEKTTKETRLTTVQDQIDKYVKKQEIRDTLKQIDEELKLPLMNDQLKNKMEALRTLKETQLKTLESA
ncbi:MAG: putative secreted protein [Candidatus Phytoplasma cynodontis]|nr:MAG: putative secreted protein [Candidatus Phytoplasma cynodontis]